MSSINSGGLGGLVIGALCFLADARTVMGATFSLHAVIGACIACVGALFEACGV